MALMSRLSPRTRRRVAVALIVGSCAMLLEAGRQLWPLARGTVTDSSRAARPSARVVSQRSEDCRSCHEDAFKAWSSSHHAHAHRPIDAAADADAFRPERDFLLNGVPHHVGWSEGKPQFTEGSAGAQSQYTAEFVLGYTPLQQFVVPVGQGRYQLTELAFDPARREWFNVFGTEQRQPGEWGHWRGRGMNWNSMCAQCHLTDFAKNYDPASDTYRSTWLEHGAGCIQCHGPISAEHVQPGYKTLQLGREGMAERVRDAQTCAPCHARNELLTGEPRAGMDYFDHFRVTLPVDPAVFYPDGQVRDEDFNWTSLLTSRMGGHSGITCLDCHEPHSGKTRLPAANNVLCLQCHAGPNARNAPIIDPTAHSHHQPNSAGNLCVACHMPTTTYMQRDPRHDHGFLKPDPLLTKEVGIPNACDRCHADRGIDWQIEANQNWYGSKLESRQRARTRVVSALQRHDDTGIERLLALVATEEVPAWKATFLQLALPWSDRADVSRAAETALTDTSPLVRDSGVLLLAATGSNAERLRPTLQDASRLVRIDAEGALAAELTAGSREMVELEQYLKIGADQPSGQLRLGQYLAMRGQLNEAASALRTAISWDPHSPVFHETLGLVLNRAGDSAGAAAALWNAATADPRNAATAFDAGLAFAAAGKTAEAETALRAAVERDASLHRAWYNLGLLLVQRHRTDEALGALHRAEAAAPRVADYPYAIATVLWGMGDAAGARAAAARALAIDPNHPGARAVLRARR